MLEYIITERRIDMSFHHIIVSQESLQSLNKHDIVNSNIQYITKLFQHNVHEDKIYEDALKSYYVDYYYSHIICGSFENFIKEVQSKHTIQYYIKSGLEALKSKKHLELFTKAFQEEETSSKHYNELNNLFHEIQKNEDLLTLNAQWLMNHPHLLSVKQDAIDLKIEEHLKTYNEDARHIKIIKQLCNIIEEEFIAVTAGDARNIYNRSWHFKTAQGYYYMIEENNIVTLYNSFTKEEITQGRLVANKTEKFTVSNFISQMLA